MMTTDCIECGKTFTRLSLKSRVKYCHDCRRPKKNRYEQREVRTKRQAVDALATQEEHGRRLDAIEMAQEAHLAEVNTISHDVAVKAANLMSDQIEDALEKMGLGDVKKLTRNMLTLNKRIKRLEKDLSTRIRILEEEVARLNEEEHRRERMLDNWNRKEGLARTNRRNRIGKVVRFLHKNEIATTKTIMSVPLKDVSKVTAYNNLKWAEEKGYIQRHKLGKKSIYSIGSKHWSDHYRRKAEKEKAKEEE